jgi:cytidylate kinase
MIIAIDGPAGSGKSTVAKLAARELGFAYLDTGAMYRAVAWRAIEEQLNLATPLNELVTGRLSEIAAGEAISFGYLPGEPVPSQVFINGKDVTAEIRLPATDVAVTPVSADPGVRAALTQQQRVIGHAANTVMEGRDIGTVVFPDAQLKIFLTATAEERAQRRYWQNVNKALQAGREYTGLSEAEILADIKRRDTADSTRASAPLVAAQDSVLLDSTNLTITEVVQQIVALARELSAGAAQESAAIQAVAPDAAPDSAPAAAPAAIPAQPQPQPQPQQHPREQSQ